MYRIYTVILGVLLGLDWGRNWWEWEGMGGRVSSCICDEIGGNGRADYLCIVDILRLLLSYWVGLGEGRRRGVLASRLVGMGGRITYVS